MTLNISKHDNVTFSLVKRMLKTAVVNKMMMFVGMMIRIELTMLIMITWRRILMINMKNEEYDYEYDDDNDDDDDDDDDGDLSCLFSDPSSPALHSGADQWRLGWRKYITGWFI